MSLTKQKVPCKICLKDGERGLRTVFGEVERRALEEFGESDDSFLSVWQSISGKTEDVIALFKGDVKKIQVYGLKKELTFNLC